MYIKSNNLSLRSTSHRVTRKPAQPNSLAKKILNEFDKKLKFACLEEKKKKKGKKPKKNEDKEKICEKYSSTKPINAQILVIKGELTSL